jgi:two-component system CheB/CheR fusion protein
MKVTTEQAERLHRFAHDLRNRLIGLRQVLEHSGQGMEGTDHEDLKLFGEKQYFKALREVEVLLDDLGVERGAITPSLEAVPLIPLVREHLDLMQHRFDGKQQRLLIDLEECSAMADRRVTGDILSALLSNASKFSASGSTITIRTHCTGAMIALEITDQGTGLSASDLEQVFDRFAWLDNVPTGAESQGRGTLSRLRDHAKAQHGALTASSPGVGHGCTFTLHLPVA